LPWVDDANEENKLTVEGNLEKFIGKNWAEPTEANFWQSLELIVQLLILASKLHATGSTHGLI
jgi:hypothetical protein